MTGSHYSDSLNYPIEMPDGQLVYPGSTTYKSTDNWNYRWSKPKIDWVYKNGDTGQQYFSIVYMTASFKQRLFYPDYIVRMHDSTIWVLETKGGEAKGADKNIDLQAKNKFKALKAYAEDNKLNWGFIRDKDNQLYFCNTEYTDKLDDNWVNLKNILI